VLGTLVSFLLFLEFNKFLVLTVFFSTFDGHNLMRNWSSFGGEAFHVSFVFTLINTLHEGVFDGLHVLGHLGACTSLELFTEGDRVLLLNLLLQLNSGFLG